MRCNNCGFENAEEAAHCIKCKTALDTRTAKQAPRASEETSASPSGGPSAPPKKEIVYGGTILDSQLAHVNKQDEPSAAITGQAPTATVAGQAQAALVQCPHPDCGYPYSSELKVCPRCQRAAASAVAAAPIHSSAPTAPPGSTPQPSAGTIDPYRTKTIIDTPPTPICYLQPIPRQGEPGQPVILSFTQSSVELNRDNLDPGNPSITGKVQAELSFDNGAWQLKDKSELQTTFILASAQTPLKDGDVILLGDRKFIFSTSPLPDK